MVALSVNVNKIAVLRNSRGGEVPSVIKAAQCVLAAGAHGITVHPRPDLRHIHPRDCVELAQLLAQSQYSAIEFNIEGNPFAAANSRYPGLLELARLCKPQQVTLVPDADGQITSDHGWKIAANAQRLGEITAQFRAINCRVSLFVEQDIAEEELTLARNLGVARIEIYTGPYAHSYAQSAEHAKTSLEHCARTAKIAKRLGLGVNAGHDLSQQNLAALRTAVPELAEVSIGHALIDEALYDGLSATVQAYLRILQ